MPVMAKGKTWYCGCCRIGPVLDPDRGLQRMPRQKARLGAMALHRKPLLDKPGLPLMPDRQHQHGIVGIKEIIKRHITGVATRNDKLAQAVLAWAANQGMTSENGNGILNRDYRFQREHPVGLGKEIGLLFQIGELNYLRHETALGRVTFSPRKRPSR